MRYLAAVISLAASSMIASAQVIDLEDVPLPPSGFLHNTAFTSHGTAFNNSYYAPFDSWGGFAASNHMDLLTPGYGNQYSAYHFPPGGIPVPNQFAVGYLEPFTPTIPRIVLPPGTHPTSVELTNTTYTALSMRDGDSFAKKFGGPTGNDPDFFYVTITGLAMIGGPVTGSIDFYLADYRFANNSMDYIIKQWTLVDLTSLGNASVLDFTFTSSDVGSIGINTPTYMALDNLQVNTVPEPASMCLGLAAVTLGVILRRAW